VGAIVARLVSDDGGSGTAATGSSTRRRDLTSLTGALATSARTAGRGSVLGGRWLTDLLIDLAPRLPMRDAATLRAHHRGLPDEDLAQVLIRGAAKAAGTVGGAGGALAAVEFVAPPTLLTTPFQIAAEGLLVATIEVKLIAELHEVYDAGVSGTARHRAGAYLVAWTNRRAVDPLDPSAMRLSLGPVATVALRRRLVRVAARNLATMGPFLSGAVAGSAINFRETRKLGEQIRADLRDR
jgi:hypothetical protein